MESSRQRQLLNEVLLQGVFLEGQIAMLEGAERRASMCQAFYLIFSIRESISFQSAAIFLCPKGTTQISHGTSTKLR